MGFKNSLKKFVKKFLINLKLKVEKLYKTEEEIYYENFFIKSKFWNSKQPNDDESSRWKIIKLFIEKYQHNKTNSRILDVGCGRGWLSNFLSDYGNVIGIEPVKNVVKYGKKLFPNIEFIVGSTPKLLPKFANSFDLIVCSEVIEHIPNDGKTKFVSEINRLLKNNGFAIFSTPRADIQNEWLKYIEPGQPVEDWITEAELENLFITNGFQKLEIARVTSIPKHGIDPMPIYQICIFQKILTN
jgi:2-polyprenyl-3-methyl-5-hydroxy-6-metoxy-1,4-benzoquinol methylase